MKQTWPARDRYPPTILLRQRFTPQIPKNTSFRRGQSSDGLVARLVHDRS
jgi:hypothetical protein